MSWTAGYKRFCARRWPFLPTIEYLRRLLKRFWTAISSLQSDCWCSLNHAYGRFQRGRFMSNELNLSGKFVLTIWRHCESQFLMSSWHCQRWSCGSHWPCLSNRQCLSTLWMREQPAAKTIYRVCSADSQFDLLKPQPEIFSLPFEWICLAIQSLDSKSLPNFGIRSQRRPNRNLEVRLKNFNWNITKS